MVPEAELYTVQFEELIKVGGAAFGRSPDAARAVSHRNVSRGTSRGRH